MRLFRLWQRNCVSLNGLPATQNGALKTLRKIVGLDEGSRRQRGGTRKPKLILDETLKGIQKALTQLFEVETGCKMPKQMKRMSTIIALIKQELDGLAVAYKDPKGRLAWKAGVFNCLTAHISLRTSLRSMAWIPSATGTFHKPEDITEAELPPEFDTTDRTGWLDEIRFGTHAMRRAS